MFKALILPSKCEYTRIVIPILLLLLYVWPSIQISVTEGQDAELTFPYPCDSTEVTIQHAHRAPFYQLTSPENQGERLRVENRIGNGNCFLDLTINDVMRNDRGTYISSVYKDGEILIDETHRILLYVHHGEYAPGKASCVEEEDKVGEWVSIACTADVGSLKGKFECYQNGELMPYLTNPVETHTTLTQTILVRKSQPVFCCSYSLISIKTRCECEDTALYLPDDSIIDPCGTATEMTDIYKGTENNKDCTFSNMTTYIPTKLNRGNCQGGIPIYILILVIVISFSGNIILVVFFKRRIKTISNQNNRSNQHTKNSVSLLERVKGLME